jgi:predicted methyltransferase
MRSTLLLLVLIGCGSATPSAVPPPSVVPPPSSTATEQVEVPEAIATVVAAQDRSEADRALDDGRHPGETLAFFHIAPGQHVAELFAGGGYTAELLARTVGSEGVVYGENPQWLLERYAQAPWTARLALPINHNVVRVDRELDDPLPPEAHDLDAVLFLFSYHDAVWTHVDRAAMNRAIFAALKPGGIYGIIDHHAAEGHGGDDSESLHRIEESLLVQEVLAAGFVLDARADFLRNPSDTRDWSASPRTAGERRGTSDRFVLRFVRPE